MSEEIQPINSDGQQDGRMDPVEIEKAIEQVDPKAFSGIPRNKRASLIQKVTSVVALQKTHVGPLPDPETLTAYSELIPNGAERIMQMAEKQQEHRMYLEKEALRRQFNQSNLGQIFAFLLGLITIGGSIFTIYNGFQWSGAFLGTAGLTGLVTAFIQGKKRQSESLSKKRPS